MLRVFSPLTNWLKLYANHRFYPALLGVVAFVGTLVESIPITILLSASVALNRRRWKLLCISAALGSALGALSLAYVFHSWGLDWIALNYPSLVKSSSWMAAERWVQSYGVLALFAAAALPITQTPFIVVCGLMKMPVPLVFLAFGLGKIVKYGTVAYPIQRSARATTRNK